MRSFRGILGREQEVIACPTGVRLTGLESIPHDVEHVLRIQVVQETRRFGAHPRRARAGLLRSATPRVCCDNARAKRAARRAPRRRNRAVAGAHAARQDAADRAPPAGARSTAARRRRADAHALRLQRTSHAATRLVSEAPAAHVRRRSGVSSRARRAHGVRAVHAARRCRRATRSPRTCASCRRSSSLSPDALIGRRGARARRAATRSSISRTAISAIRRSGIAIRSRIAWPARDAPRPSTIATSAWSATSSTCGRRTATCTCRRSRRRTRSPATRATRSASARTSIRGSSNARWAADRTGSARSSSASASSTGASPGSSSAVRAARLFAERRRRGVPRSLAASAIYEQARMIVGNLSRFSSANNHLIGEAAGVYVAASHLAAVAADARLGRALPRHPRSGMPSPERARRRQSRAGIRATRPSCSISCCSRDSRRARAARTSRLSTGAGSRS